MRVSYVALSSPLSSPAGTRLRARQVLAPRRPAPAFAALVLALLLALPLPGPLGAVSGPTTALAQGGDDWSLTREPRRGPSRPRRPSSPGSRRRRPPPTTTAPADRPDRFAILSRRYLAVLASRPMDDFAFERLLELHRRKHGDLDALETQLQPATAAPPEATAGEASPSSEVPVSESGPRPAGEGTDADVDAADPAEDGPRPLPVEVSPYARRILLGRLLEARGRPEEAAADYQAARRLRPEEPAPRVALGRLARARGDQEEARGHLVAAVEATDAGPAREALVRDLAEIELDLGDIASARARYDRLSRGGGASIYVRTELARALEARGRFSEAAEEYARVVRGLSGDARAQAPVLRDQGRAELSGGRVDEAVETLERGLRLVGRRSGLRVELLELLVDAYRQGNRLPALVERLEREGGPVAAGLLGRLYDELQREDEAVAAYRRALRAQPRDLDTRLRLIQLLSRSGRLEDAMAQYEALIRAAPGEPRFVVELAQLLMQTGRRDEALRLAASTGRRHPRDPVVHQALAQLYARWGEDARAAEEIELLARIDPQDPAHLVALGAQQLAEGDRQGAMTTWRRILRTEPNEARAQATLGGVLADHDQLDAAVTAYEKAVALDPDELTYVRGLASALERLRRNEEALRSWNRVLDLAEDDRAARREARGRIVAIHGRAGSIDRKIAGWKRAFAADPPDVEAGRFLAEAHLRARPRRLDEAERVLSRVTALAPGEVESLLALERVRTARGDLDGAIDVLDRLVEADPARAPSYLQRMAEHALALYRDDRAVAYAARAVSLSPEDAEGHARLGDLYRSRQDTERALASYRRALELDPRRFDTAFDLAEVYLARGELEDADRWLRRLVRSAPDDDLVSRAARSAIQVNLGLGTLGDLEKDLLPLAVGHPQRPVFRRALVELYDALAAPLIRAVEAGKKPEADQARERLAEIGTRGIKPLLEALADGDPEQRRVALDVLGYLDHPAAAVPLVAAAEGDGAAELRARALVAAGAVASPELGPRFAALAEGPERRLRGAATFALGQLGDRRSLARLETLLEAPDVVVRAHAALGLGAAGERRAVDALAERLGQDRSPFVRAAAAWALGRLGSESAASRLAAAMMDADPLLRLAATAALGRLEGPAARAALAAAVFDPDPSLRAMAGTALRARGRPSPDDELGDRLPLPVGGELGPAYLRRLLDVGAPESLPPPALELLGAPALGDALGEALRGPPERVRAALEALGEGCPPSLPTGLGPLTAGCGRWEASAARAVGERTEALARSAWSPIAGAARHVDPGVRALALQVVGALGGDDATSVLVRGLDDPDRDVRLAALDAIAASPDPGRFGEPVAGRLQDDEEWSIRMRAAEVLGMLGRSSPNVVAALVAALDDDPYAYVRAAAARGLDPVSGEAARRALRTAADADPEPTVRRAAGDRLAAR